LRQRVLRDRSLLALETFAISAFGLFGVAILLSVHSFTPAKLWSQQRNCLNSPFTVQFVVAVLRKGAPEGGSGLVLPAWGLNGINKTVRLPGCARQVFAGAQSKNPGAIPPALRYGYSRGILNQRPGLAEGQHVTGVQYQVNAWCNRLDLISDAPGSRSSGFKSGSNLRRLCRKAGGGAGMATTHTGSSSVRISHPPRNARVCHTTPTTAGRQYRLWAWATSSELNYYAGLNARPSNTSGPVASIRAGPDVIWR
jgi:hypothetical protein